MLHNFGEHLLFSTHRAYLDELRTRPFIEQAGGILTIELGMHARCNLAYNRLQDGLGEHARCNLSYNMMIL